VARTEERSGRGRAFAHLSGLETKRLLLRKVRLVDAEAMFAYASDPEVTR
jgi:RimJ/RimL family protein N-acetyltransferase